MFYLYPCCNDQTDTKLLGAPHGKIGETQYVDQTEIIADIEKKTTITLSSNDWDLTAQMNYDYTGDCPDDSDGNAYATADSYVNDVADGTFYYEPGGVGEGPAEDETNERDTHTFDSLCSVYDAVCTLDLYYPGQTMYTQVSCYGVNSYSTLDNLEHMEVVFYVGCPEKETKKVPITLISIEGNGWSGDSKNQGSSTFTANGSYSLTIFGASFGGTLYSKLTDGAYSRLGSNYDLTDGSISFNFYATMSSSNAT
jgi:hypothetical protein